MYKYHRLPPSKWLLSHSISCRRREDIFQCLHIVSVRHFFVVHRGMCVCVCWRMYQSVGRLCMLSVHECHRKWSGWEVDANFLWSAKTSRSLCYVNYVIKSHVWSWFQWLNWRLSTTSSSRNASMKMLTTFLNSFLADIFSLEIIIVVVDFEQCGRVRAQLAWVSVGMHTTPIHLHHCHWLVATKQTGTNI